MKPYAEKFYKSTAWKSCREEAIRRAGGLCERCWKEGKVTAAVVAHHIIPITPDNIDDPSITLNLSNLMALCTECHAAVHSNGVPKRYKIDELGRIAPRS